MPYMEHMGMAFDWILFLFESIAVDTTIALA